MQENILIIGNGGREYAMGLVLKNDRRVGGLYFAPGNGGTHTLGINIIATKHTDILESIKKYAITLVIIGPEAPLSEGLSDFLREHNVRVFGPSLAASRLESSKAYMKDLVSKAGIKTAKYMQSNDLNALSEFIHTLTPPIVIKADGLCAGKGVIIAQSHKQAIAHTKEMLSGDAFGDAGKRVVIEEFLDGYELSVFAISDGKDFIMLPACQDHKRLLSGDNGPNTGGMGAYTPTPLCDESLLEKIKVEIIAPTLQILREQGTPFVGVLFGGIMVCKRDNELTPYLLEFNVRFGDPECEVLMPLLETPLLDIVIHAIDGKIAEIKCNMAQKYAVAVVASSKDYPYKSSPAVPISVKEFDENLGHIVYAGVSLAESGEILASGGRVLLAVGLAHSLSLARDNAYEIMKHISFEGMHYRDDIAFRALGK